MIPVISPAYLPPIEYVAWLLQQETLYFNTTDHFQKQTYRNRCEILGANGVLKLSIPITHQAQKTHQNEIEVIPFNSVPWQKQHWKSLSIAYRSAPFFEFYEYDLKPLFETQPHKLWDWNLLLIDKILSLLNLPFSYEVVSFDPEQHKRMEYLLNAKVQRPTLFPSYRQVFSDRLGFQANLSIVDLLFNLGPESEAYLNKIVPIPSTEQ